MDTFRRAAALAALCAAAGLSQEAAEKAAVQKIHDRIAKQAAHKAGAYKVTIPNTTISYEMAPIPAGEFQMGSTAKPDEEPSTRSSSTRSGCRRMK